MKWLLILLFSTNLFAAEDVEKSPWAHESEASVAISNGNTKSESYIGKQKTTYTVAKEIFALSGAYRKTLSEDSDTGALEESGLYWELGVRYDHMFSKYFSVFIGYKSSSDIHSENVQKDAWDLGGKYAFVKSKETDLFVELGYRNTYERNVYPNPNNSYHSVRTYAEGERRWNKNFSTKLWVEYLIDVADSEDYETNFEGSLRTVLTDILSLKVAYEGKYDNAPSSDDAEFYDSLFTTSLIAKF